jgi:hypothetical protein
MKTLRTTLLVAAALAGAHVGPARAQVVPWDLSYGLYELDPATGTDRLVGEVYREDTGATGYTEHWVLYPEYVYPSEANGLAVTIRPGLSVYRNTEDFLARVPWAHGSRYVKTTCADGTTLPVAR